MKNLLHLNINLQFLTQIAGNPKGRATTSNIYLLDQVLASFEAREFLLSFFRSGGFFLSPFLLFFKVITRFLFFLSSFFLKPGCLFAKRTKKVIDDSQIERRVIQPDGSEMLILKEPEMVYKTKKRSNAKKFFRKLGRYK